MATIDADSAVAITAEFFASLDNVKEEVGFLLDEIRSRDHMIMEHLRKAESRGNNLYRSVRPPPTSSTNPSQPTTLLPATPREPQAHTRVLLEYTKLTTLQDEKIALADKLVRIVTRHRERARDEWRKIVGDDAANAWDASLDAETSAGGAGGAGVSLAGIAWLVAKLPAAASAAQVAGWVQRGLGAGTPGLVADEKSKKRKSSHTPQTSYFDIPPTTTTAGTRASPHPLATTHRPTKSRRISSTPPASPPLPPAAGQVEAEHGETGEAEAEGDGGDDTLYCFCQEKSHGQMIGCDNEACRFEWFHVKCMKLDPDKLPERWFCPECVKILGFSSSTGDVKAGSVAGGGDKYKKTKGRKK